MNVVQKLFATDSSNVSALLIRVTLGAVMLAHGLQNLFGWFGGHGFNATMQMFNYYRFERMSYPGDNDILYALKQIAEQRGSHLPLCRIRGRSNINTRTSA